MQERERVVVTGLIVLLLGLWLGFLVHRAPTFAGSLGGTAIGVLAAALLLVPAAYSVVKRVPRLRTAVTHHVPLRTLLAWHIYAGIVGPILAIVHTGHRFESPLGIALTAAMIVVALSGFVGRYLLVQVGADLRDRLAALDRLRAEFDVVTTGLAQRPDARATLGMFDGFFARLVGGVLTRGDAPSGPDARLAPARVLGLVDALADEEYAVATHARFKQLFAGWLRVHLALSGALYALLALHVWAGLHFGLRWRA